MQQDTNEQGRTKLILALAEHMKLPLMQIARRAELMQLGLGTEGDLEVLQLTADSAIKLIDSYLLSMRLAGDHFKELEPVSVAAVLTDTAHELSKLAEKYAVNIELDISRSYEPVLIHRKGLVSAMTSLGHLFLESPPTSAGAPQVRPVLRLAAHRSQNGIVAGIFSSDANISREMYARSGHLLGKARHVMPESALGNGATVFIADALLQTMSSHLRVARHHKMSGLAATLMSSHQLALV